MMRTTASNPSNATRRRFLALSGAGAVAAALGGWTGELAIAAQKNKKDKKAARSAPPPPKKYPLTLGMASYSVRKFPLDKAIEMTKRLALPMICLKSFHLPMNASKDEITAVAAKVKEAGLTLYGCGVVSMKKEADVDQAFEYAKTAGMKVIVASPSIEMLPVVNKKVQQYEGILVAIHNHGPTDKTFPMPRDVMKYIQSLDKRIGLCIDVGHTERVGDDAAKAAEQFADRLYDIHIKDVTEATPAGREIEMGRGVIDIPRFLRTLMKINYRGVVSFEHESDPDDPLPGLSESVGYVRGIMAAS